MIKLCQYDNCENIAVWSIKTATEAQGFKVCSHHRKPVLDAYKRLGYTNPEINLA